MAEIRAIVADGQWTNASSWDLGRIPNVDDDVFIGNSTIRNSEVSISVKSINIGANGLLYANGNAVVINADIYCEDENHMSISFSGNNTNIRIVGNTNKLQCYFGYASSLQFYLIGNCNKFRIYRRSGGNDIWNFTGDIDDIAFTDTTPNNTYARNLNIYGTCKMYEQLYPANVTMNIGMLIEGKLTIENFILQKLRILTIQDNSSVDYSNENNEYFFYNGSCSIGQTVTITKRGSSIPQSVVLEGYQYGDKVGTLKTVPDNVTIVNLTEQQLQRVGNCATVSTVQKCFEEFKE